MNAISKIKSDMDFTAEIAPLYGPDAKPVSPDIGRAVVRDDTGETIAICGRGFKPVQHREVFSPVLKFFADHGYEVAERNHDRAGLYDLAGRKGAFIKYGLTARSCGPI